MAETARRKNLIRLDKLKNILLLRQELEHLPNTLDGRAMDEFERNRAQVVGFSIFSLLSFFVIWIRRHQAFY